MEQRLIDANALYKKLEDRYKCANGGLLRFAYKDAIDDVCNAPTIDPVKHGRWIDTPRKNDRVYCSCCAENCKDIDEVDRQGYFRFFRCCPDCGARMDGGTP